MRWSAYRQDCTHRHFSVVIFMVGAPNDADSARSSLSARELSGEHGLTGSGGFAAAEMAGWSTYSDVLPLPLCW
jgi:hypothetical protein